MSVDVRWLGHACWQITAEGKSLIIDPFLNDSPTAPIKADAVQANYVLITHGHFDHIADAASIANRCQARVLACYEIATWLQTNHGVADVIGMNLGGKINLNGLVVKFVQAWHSSQLPDGSYGGNPGGFIIEWAGRRIYVAGDTALFSDLQLFAEPKLDLAVLPIGDLFTMGPEDSLTAIRWLRPDRVAPSHYNTWPPIAQDAQAWAEQVKAVTDAKPIVLEPGQSISI